MENLLNRKYLVWLGLLCVSLLVLPFVLKNDSENLELLYLNYTMRFNKSTNPKDLDERIANFQESVLTIENLNAREEDNILLAIAPTLQQSSKTEGLRAEIEKRRWKPGMPKNKGYARWGLTPYADMSREEFQTTFLDFRIHERIRAREEEHRRHGHNKNSHHHHHGYNYDHSAGNIDGDDKLVVRKRRAINTSDLPLKVDWRTKGVVSSVKQQKDCGACWAFSTVETVESMNALKNGKLEPLSVQQVIDCANNGNMGCNGGDICLATEWMASHKVSVAKAYPLTLKTSPCLLKNVETGVQVNSNYTCDNYEGNEDALLAVLAHHGPVAVAVDATNWQFYVGGIIRWNCEANNNHAVQIVGYDKTSDPPYYIVRNSWGTAFGDNGYLYVAIGSNLCGIAREAVSLSVK